VRRNLKPVLGACRFDLFVNVEYFPVEREGRRHDDVDSILSSFSDHVCLDGLTEGVGVRPKLRVSSRCNGQFGDCFEFHDVNVDSVYSVQHGGVPFIEVGVIIALVYRARNDTKGKNYKPCGAYSFDVTEWVFRKQ